ncbi:hypothetical protein KTD26_33265 [Burkholderia multivorans]|uniref:hypothetical protein n=1 Tax=Burkholderia multivorans TaxID=87883 RepID=UPI001C22C4ED|nr:hypothetical protein [Burkholderia multivorans]MBU9147355.1 hypothetical protein [Burkholderia multivorans]
MADETTKPSRNRFRKIEVRMWGDEKFRRLTPIPPCGQGLWIFLLTGPHTGPIPGLFRCGRAAMAEELDWDLEAFDEAFAEASREGIVKADWKAKVVWIPNAIKCNRPESPNVVRSWGAEWDLIPECDLKKEAYKTLQASICGLGEGFSRAFFESFGKASSKPSAKTCANQEQEQEQEQEKTYPNPDGLGVASAADDPIPAAIEADLSHRRQKPSHPPCPHQQIIAAYHELLPASPRIRDWTPARADHLRCRWNEDPKRQNLDWWRRFFGYIAESAFLTGRATSGDRRPFTPGLDWICKAENFAKIREGRFHDEEAA